MSELTFKELVMNAAEEIEVGMTLKDHLNDKQIVIAVQELGKIYRQQENDSSRLRISLNIIETHDNDIQLMGLLSECIAYQSKELTVTQLNGIQSWFYSRIQTEIENRALSNG